MKKIAAIIAFAIAIPALTSCSAMMAGREYADNNNMWKLGYSDMQLSAKSYRVSFAGYGIPQSECDEFALMRAAEISNNQNSKFFRVLNEKQTSTTQTHYIPGQTYTTGTVNNSGRFNANSFSTGMMISANYPVTTITIELLGDQSADGAYESEMIWSSLAKKHSVSR